MQQTDPRRPARWERAAAAAGAWLRSLDLDGWDGTCALGLAAVFAGLWLWFGLGVALTVVGVLLLALGVAGARNAGRVPADTTATGQA